jgi:hypothetical protein
VAVAVVDKEVLVAKGRGFITLAQARIHAVVHQLETVMVVMIPSGVVPRYSLAVLAVLVVEAQDTVKP